VAAGGQRRRGRPVSRFEPVFPEIDERPSLGCKAPCTPACDRPVKTGGLCSAHAERRRVGLSLDTPIHMKIRTPCKICGTPTTRARRKYCSQACKAEAARRSPNRGTFRAGSDSRQRLPIGSLSLRRGRMWIKIAEPGEWRNRAIWIWEQANGLLPSGYVVHHRNRDRLDDRLENLQALTRAEHINEHRSEIRP
jgi:HNH endonuclease